MFYLKLELFVFGGNSWNHITVCMQINSNNSFKNNVTKKLFAYK